MTLQELVQGYYEYRGLAWPDATQALMFLVSEVGELADAQVHEVGGWVRNHERERNPADEAADVLMMLMVYCINRGIDPLEALKAKMARKGYVPGETNEAG